MKIKSYLHHILPPFSILVVVVSVVQVGVGLLHVDAAGAASLPDLTVCAAHVDEPKDGEGNRNRDQDVVYDGSEVQAGFFFGGCRFFVCINYLEIY